APPGVPASTPVSPARIDFSKAHLHTRAMSNKLPPKPRIVGPKLHVSIVASKYNENFTNALVENAVEELEKQIPHARIDIVRVPGAFEIPVVVANLLRHQPPACVIALGLIIRGSTDHADLIGQSVTQSLQQLAVESLCPVIHEVLLVADETQARARCMGDQLNRGREAARTAARMIEVVQELARNSGRNPQGIH
ncbi:MAG: 6,7-dimethyl-8-ribityllumazine synthase, partial [Akkermansiaceae bacterium]|nr:6,7-dimethyl-8-ribityllumazine synthase [Akkermansiaceae bacterium]